jgi:uncharacterized protein YbjT (DUF2867 family)
LQRRWQYLAEAQRLSHSGTFGWKVRSGELVWSDETYRILGFTRETNPTLDLVFDRIHPEDRLCKSELSTESIDMQSTVGQIQLVIVGATGMVGGYALRYALDHAAVGSVTSVGRRKLGISHPKLKELLHENFADCSALADALSGRDAAVYCLGTYTGSVSDAELRAITTDYTIEFARVLRSSSPNAAFSFLSGNGADPTGRSRLAFARYKGQAEKALLAAGFPRVYLFRPAYIYPVEPRKEPSFGYRLLRAVYPLFQVLFPDQVIRADDLARAMVDVVLRQTQEREGLVFENRDIRGMVKSQTP